MFEKMRHAALEWLYGREPVEIARNAGVEFDGDAFRFRSF